MADPVYLTQPLAGMEQSTGWEESRGSAGHPSGRYPIDVEANP